VNARRWVLAAGVLALAGTAGAGFTGAAAQEAEERGIFGNNAEVTVYRDAAFNGPAVTVTQAQSNMRLSSRIQSVRVRSGRWEMCEEPNYRGECWTVERDNSMFGPAFKGRWVQSMRPIGGSGGSGGSGGTEPGRNPSLSGMAAEFYPAPARGGYRVLACANGNATTSCAKRSADQFCSSMRWRSAAREEMETVRGRVYLADVLCSNTGY
jgi:hypothetical protein